MAFINFCHPEGASLALENLYDHARYRLITPAVVDYAKSNGATSNVERNRRKLYRNPGSGPAIGSG
jgi:hypothetical protein